MYGQRETLGKWVNTLPASVDRPIVLILQISRNLIAQDSVHLIYTSLKFILIAGQN